MHQGIRDGLHRAILPAGMLTALGLAACGASDHSNLFKGGGAGGAASGSGAQPADAAAGGTGGGPGGSNAGGAGGNTGGSGAGGSGGGSTGGSSSGGSGGGNTGGASGSTGGSGTGGSGAAGTGGSGQGDAAPPGPDACQRVSCGSLCGAVPDGCGGSLDCGPCGTCSAAQRTVTTPCTCNFLTYVPCCQGTGACGCRPAIGACAAFSAAGGDCACAP